MIYFDILQKLKETGKPKRPVNSYILFLNDYIKSAKSEERNAALKTKVDIMKANREVSTDE